MFYRVPLLAFALTVLAGCTDIAQFGAIAIENRRTMNDIQARATLSATCDISIGAYFRELNEVERRYTALVCGGVAEPLPALTTLNPAPAASQTFARGTLPPGTLAPAFSVTRAPQPHHIPRPAYGQVWQQAPSF